MPTHDQPAEHNARYKHGMYKSVEYRHWVDMKCRCAKDEHYRRYGITVCPEWQKDFMAFYSHIGPKPFPKATVDRIDGTRGYEPGNVRWATYSEQNRNLVYRERHAKPRIAMAEKLNVHVNTLLYREKHGIALDAPKYGEHPQCPNGHEYTEKNTYITKRGTRKCRTCLAAVRRRQRAQKTAELAGINNKVVPT